MRLSRNLCRLDGSVGRAAIAYSAIVFAAGFVLGAVRVFIVAPHWGELPAVLLEAPIMLFVSWLACGQSIQTFRIRGRAAGLATGAVAFALLISAELALSLLGFGRSLADFVRVYQTPAGVVGLASQIAFGLFPSFRAGR